MLARRRLTFHDDGVQLSCQALTIQEWVIQRCHLGKPTSQTRIGACRSHASAGIVLVVPRDIVNSRVTPLSLHADSSRYEIPYSCITGHLSILPRPSSSSHPLHLIHGPASLRELGTAIMAPNTNSTKDTKWVDVLLTHSSLRLLRWQLY